MKKTVLFFCAVTMLCTACWCILIRELAPASIQANWINGIYIRKEAAARLASEKTKVLIIGGSGVHYGFSAEKITKLTGLTTINFGIHAGLGAAYMLDRAKRSLRPGDTAVVALEPNLYKPIGPSDVLSEYILHFDWSYLFRADIVTGIRIVFGLAPDKLLRIVFLRTIPWTSPLARSETVSDVTGDEALRVSTLINQTTRDVLARSTPMSLNLPPEIPSFLKNFLDWAHTNSICVVEAWTPMLNNPAYETEPYRSFFATIAAWYQREGATPLNDPSAFFLSIDEMFDYAFHANEYGRDSASIALASQLERMDSSDCAGNARGSIWRVGSSARASP
jgi:hypothetical protein